MGKRDYPVQDVDEVLGRFFDRRPSALQEYQSFVEAGIDQGAREDLRGGGLVRSAGGIASVMARCFEEREVADERILGSGDFVDTVLEAKEKVGGSSTVSVESILEEISASTGIATAVILGQSRERTVSSAAPGCCFLLVPAKKLGDQRQLNLPFGDNYNSRNP